MTRLWAAMVMVLAGAAFAKEREYAFGGPWPTPPPPPAPIRFANGGVEGVWAWLEAGVLGERLQLSEPFPELRLGPWAIATLGAGVDLGRVHLRATARAAVDATIFRVRPDEQVRGTPVAIALAAANLIDDQQLTGLRLTPALGVTIPTRFDSGIALTTLSGALQLERRFGPVELAWRPEVFKPFWPAPVGCTLDPTVDCYQGDNTINWALGNRLQAEWWFLREASVGLRLSHLVSFNFLLAGAYGVPAQTVPDTRQSTTGELWLNYAFHRLFGLSLQLTSQQPLRRLDRSLYVPFFGFYRTTVVLSVWFRTDGTLERNWIER